MMMWSTLYSLCLFVFLGILLFLVAFLPLSYRLVLMRRYQYFFLPLTKKLLFPASYREKCDDIQLKRGRQKGSLIVIFGGNDETVEESYALFEKFRLADGERLEQTNFPVAIVPLWALASEEIYVEKFMLHFKELLKELEHPLKELEILAHSLGGALATTCLSRIRQELPEVEIRLTLDRTFSQLSEPAHHLHGFFGDILERTLGILWSLKTAERVKKFQDDAKIHIDIYQIEPDHILGERSLLSVALRSELWRLDWQIHHYHGQRQDLHGLAFHEAFDKEAR